MKTILVVEPYYGGSHKQFLEGLSRWVEAQWIFLTLPARKWKMRMQLSAIWFEQQVRAMPRRHFHAVLCSTFVDVAVLRSLLAQLEGWNPECIFCTYFHENQYVYPSQIEDGSRYQFTSINFTTALASDRIAFNSIYNRDSFFDHGWRYLRKAADMDLGKCIEEMAAKATVLYPGQDFNGLADVSEEKNNPVPVICWNHRWEHDKNPEEFFRVLMRLDDLGQDFRLVVLGQSFSTAPPIFAEARKVLGPKIIHFGYAESRAEYFRLLALGDIVISTARHEFFGIAVLEAVRAGCIPLVPDRLSYPELYPRQYRYREGELGRRLLELLQVIRENGKVHCRIDTEKYSWSTLHASYRHWLALDG